MFLLRLQTDAGLDGLGEAVPLSLRGGPAWRSSRSARGNAAPEARRPSTRRTRPGGRRGLRPHRAGRRRPARWRRSTWRCSTSRARRAAGRSGACSGVERRRAGARATPPWSPVHPDAVAADAARWAERRLRHLQAQARAPATTSPQVARRARGGRARGADPGRRQRRLGVEEAPAVLRMSSRSTSSSSSSRSPTLEEMAERRGVRPRSRSPPTRASRRRGRPRGRRRAGACDLATVKLAKVGGHRSRRSRSPGAARLPLQRARRPGRDRRGRPCCADAARPGRPPGSPTGSPPSASSPATIAAVECELRGRRARTSPTAPGSGSRSTRRRSRPPAVALAVTRAHRLGSATWTRPTATPRSPRPSSRSWRAAGSATRSSRPGSRSTPLAVALWRAAGDRGQRDRRRALGRLLRARRRAGDRDAGRDALHLRHRRRPTSTPRSARPTSRRCR